MTSEQCDEGMVYGVPVDVAKRRLAKLVKQFEGQGEASWGWIEGRSLALARLELGEDPIPKTWEHYAEAEDIREVIQGKYDEESENECGF